MRLIDADAAREKFSDVLAYIRGLTMAGMKEWFRKLRYKLAYLIAPDWIDDLEYRFSCFLCEQTGGRMSKCYYTVEAMRSEADDYQMRVCEDCEFYKEGMRNAN